jgi:hypothetical protein
MMPYKGGMYTGSAVDVTFSSNYTNNGTALLLVGLGTLDGQSIADMAAIAPGGTATLRIACDDPGILRISVDATTDADSGQLAVAIDGVGQADESITGDTTWTYSVVRRTTAEPAQPV